MIFRYKIEIISDIEQKIRKLLVNIAVAPFVGVWVEIITERMDYQKEYVAPFVGVWVEINYRNHIMINYIKSLPSWECGLKSILKGEIDYNLHRRSLRGSVG